MKPISRRSFFATSVAVIATLVSAESTSASSTYKLGKVGKFKTGSLAIVTVPGRTEKISVLVTSKGYFAFSTSCTHQGFQLKVSGKKLVCNNHGAQFDSKTGRAISGPATKSLTKYKTSVKKGYLYITL